MGLDSGLVGRGGGGEVLGVVELGEGGEVKKRGVKVGVGQVGEERKEITVQLRRYGSIEGKNIFYWFQNHKDKER